MYVGSYNSALVLCSLAVAVLACYTALDMAGRTATARGQAARWWLAGGAFAIGVGIWSMHFVGMLAFSLPISLGYDIGLTVLSLFIGIVSAAFALWMICQDTLPWLRLAGGAVLMGTGVAGMHYTGMAALRMTPAIDYEPTLFVLSILIAIVASGCAMWIAFRLRHVTRHTRLLRVGAALVMGGAIVGMHYTGMAAAQFPLGSVCGAAGSGGVDSNWLAILIIVVTLAVIAIALVTSVLDLRMEARTSVLASSLAEANEELTYLALHDNLTKLPNRLLLEDRLQQAIHTSTRERTYFAVMFMDLDGFKAVNDAYGHHIGDRLLIEVAARIRANVRAQDTVARLGGDEFVLVTQIEDPADASTIASKLVRIIEDEFDVEGHQLHVSASVGIAVYPGNGADQHELIGNADAAMYYAKSSGRNTYCYFEASMNQDVQAQVELLRDLRHALLRDELMLQYQPKFHATSGIAIGAEALVRWNHPVRGIVQPAVFIPLAEKTGLIIQIGEWVLDEACRQMKVWYQAGFTSWSMAVNLSLQQFNHAGLVQVVRNTLTRHGLPASSLTLEITESTAMRDVESTLATLAQLHEMGVKISIDDFGTGYSSLMYLKRLPATELKIDRGFVRELERDSEDAAIVSAIVALGQTLNLQIVAEGVETREQQEFLTRLGCDSLQGFLLGRPMSADSLMESVMQQESLRVA
jgi:diguanylate cyclase (GGDEF)-like protein